MKAYNYRMGGADRHDRLVGQHNISLTSKRGYIKIFFHILGYGQRLDLIQNS